MPRLKRQFFLQPTVKVAKSLLGKFLVHEYRGKKLSGMIVETEAYVGPQDRASHSFGGKMTSRNKIMFDEGGKAYPYLIYGMYWLFNITTTDKGKPEAVLIRALSIKGADGPGKLGRLMNFSKSCYGEDLCKPGARVYVEDRGIKVKSQEIKAMPRVGIDYAGPKWAKKPWRFVLNRKLM